jgi:hypothetical protein
MRARWRVTLAKPSMISNMAVEFPHSQKGAIGGGRLEAWGQALQPHLARGPKQVRADLTTFKRNDEDAFGPTCRQPFKVGLAHRQRQLAQIVTARTLNL